MSGSAVRVEVRPDQVAVLTIDQPGRSANVLTPALWSELDAALAALEADAGVRGLVIASGKPDVFIAGADLKFFLNLPGPNDPTCRAYVEQGLAVLDRLERLPFPTCAAIDGAALGGGLEVALACDFRVFGQNERLMLELPEVRLGLIPGWGGTQRLPRIIGMRDAYEMLVDSVATRWLSSGNGERGLGHHTQRSDSLVEDAIDFMLRNSSNVSELRSCKASPVPVVYRLKITTDIIDSSAAEREAIKVFADGISLPLADAIRLETEAFLRLAGSDESKRLIAEFFASRKKV